MKLFLLVLLFASFRMSYSADEKSEELLDAELNSKGALETESDSEEFLDAEKSNSIVKMNKSEVCQCRLRSINRIVGGEEADRNSIPWMVSLAYDDDEHFCNGVIINKNFVLTTARCLIGREQEKIKARVGLYRLDDENVNDKTYSVKYIALDGLINNTESHDPSKPGDIAILELERSITFESGLIEPACLNFDKKEYKDMFMASGWGSTTPKEINYMTNEVIEGDEPYPILKKIFFYEYDEDNEEHFGNHFIYVRSHSGDSMCSGDAGGPLHYTDEGLTSVEGISSLSSSIRMVGNIRVFCKGTNFFSRLSYYKDLVESVIGSDYCSL